MNVKEMIFWTVTYAICLLTGAEVWIAFMGILFLIILEGGIEELRKIRRELEDR